MHCSIYLTDKTGHSGAVVAYWTGDLKVPGSTPSPGLGTLNQVPGLQSLRKTIVLIKKGRKTPVYFLILSFTSQRAVIRIMLWLNIQRANYEIKFYFINTNITYTFFPLFILHSFPCTLKREDIPENCMHKNYQQT